MMVHTSTREVMASLGYTRPIYKKKTHNPMYVVFISGRNFSTYAENVRFIGCLFHTQNTFTPQPAPWIWLPSVTAKCFPLQRPHPLALGKQLLPPGLKS